MVRIETYANPELKKMLEEGILDVNTVAGIAGIKNDKARDKVSEMAKYKSSIELRQEVVKQNLLEKTKLIKTGKVSPRDGGLIKERLLTKICNKMKVHIREVNNMAETYVILSNTVFVMKLSHSEKKNILAYLKPLKNKLDIALKSINKTIEEMMK